ncbi:hypothetical protein SDC9_199704 [bioreactor metagenome]|uniref:Uncharacterized protein n=1 Tax=bioreactor metagenome TaxID=1076179 RepID=A0A645IMH4_9ZZZZ
MYDRLTNTNLNVFSAPTKEYVGKFNFVPSNDAESKLLNLLNYNKIPDSLIILNATLYSPPGSYTPPEPFKKYRREGILSAVAGSSNSGNAVPIEIRLKYDMRARVQPDENLYYYDSMELSNIEIVRIEQTQF